MYSLLLIAAFVPQISAYVDCKIACYRCRENKEHPLVLEVHCAMCEECKLRRRERLNSPPLGPTQTPSDKVTALAAKHRKKRIKEDLRDHSKEHSDGYLMENPKHYRKHSIEVVHSAEDSGECPTPPPCEESEEVVPLKVTTKLTTITTPSTTTKKQCPPVVTCRKKKRKQCTSYPCMPCMPCMPMCAAPCPQTSVAPVAPVAPMVLTSPQPLTTSDYYYVYVGVPKKLINH